MGTACDCYCYCTLDASEESGGDGILCSDCLDGIHVPEDYDYDDDDYYDDDDDFPVGVFENE